MATYKELISQIEQLKTQAEEARHNELISAISEIRQRMAELGITMEDLAGTSKRARKSAAAAAVKYRNPQTGQGWSGRGRTPHWITEAESRGESRSQFLAR